MPKRHLINRCLVLFLRQYLYLRSISTFGDVNALCDQTPAPICTFKMVEIQLLSFSLRQYSFFSDPEAGGKRRRRDRRSVSAYRERMFSCEVFVSVEK